MPLYLIRETNAPNVSTTAPVAVHEIEIEAATLRAAAEMVMNRPQGRLPDGMRFRSPTHEPYSGGTQYIKPDSSRYAGIADIVAGKPETLPKATRVPTKEFLDGAKAALAFHTKVLGIDDEGNTGTALYHLFHSLIDYAHSVDTNFGKTLQQVLDDRLDVTGQEAPPVISTSFGADTAAPGAIAAGKAALDLHSTTSGIEGAEDPEIALYHLLHSTIDLCDVEGVDFAETLEQVRVDRPAAPPLGARI